MHFLLWIFFVIHYLKHSVTLSQSDELAVTIEKASEEGRQAENKYHRLQQELTEKLDKAKLDAENIQRQLNAELKVKDDECKILKNKVEQIEDDKQEMVKKLNDNEVCK